MKKYSLIILFLAMYVLPMTAGEALLLHFQTGKQSILLDDIQRITFVGDDLQIKTAEGIETVALGDFAKIHFGEMLVMDVPVVVGAGLAPAPQIVGYYNIMGQKLLQEPQSGVYIIMYSNGTAEKVVK